MKAALYVRVSTVGQAEDGFSIAAQINLLNEYCTKNNILVYEVYADEGISGQKEDRPQFQKMIKDAESKHFDIILVHKFDRFARKVELSRKIKERLRKSNINVVSITEPMDDSPIGFFSEGILELLSEYFVRNLSLETKKGQVERARQGLDNGSLPYGYKRDKETGGIAINEEQAQIVRTIFDLYVNHGYGLSRISNYLNAAKVKTAISGQWCHSSVSCIIKNVKYIGKILYDGEIYEGKHPAIIDDETFNLAAKYLKDRTWKREYRGINFQRRLLMGLLYCGECSRKFRVHTYKNKLANGNPRITSTDYYQCNVSTHTDRNYGCDFRKTFNCLKLEEYVLDYIKDVMNGLITNYTVVQRTPISDLKHNKIKELTKELERAKKAYLAGAFELDEYTKIKIKNENEIKELNSIGQETKSDIPTIIKNRWHEFESAQTIPEKRAVLQKFIDRIVVSRVEIKIILYV